MKAGRQRSGRWAGGYMLTELLVYMALLFVILGLGYVAVDKYIDHSVVLRRNAEDIARVLEVGERWRADVRAATSGVHLETNATEQCLYLEGPKGKVAYRFADGAISRRVGSGPWSVLIPNAKASGMLVQRRQQVTAWRWELELQPHVKASARAGRVRPLFTFTTVSPTGPTS